MHKCKSKWTAVVYRFRWRRVRQSLLHDSCPRWSESGKIQCELVNLALVTMNVEPPNVFAVVQRQPHDRRRQSFDTPSSVHYRGAYHELLRDFDFVLRRNGELVVVNVSNDCENGSETIHNKVKTP